MTPRPDDHRTVRRLAALIATAVVVIGSTGVRSTAVPSASLTGVAAQFDVPGFVIEPPDTGAVDLPPLDRPLRDAADAVALSDGRLRELVASETSGGGARPAEVRVIGDRVHVEILHVLSVAAIDTLIEDLGGEVTGRVPGTLVEADVPIRRLAALEASAGVSVVRPPLDASVPLDPMPASDEALGPHAIGGSFIGQELSKTNVRNWHAAGFTGAGVRVGIIDFFNGSLWNAAQAAGEVPAPSGTFCRQLSSTCSAFGSPTGVGEHGVAVAEIIHEMAPKAQLYLATASSTADLQAAVDYFDRRGVVIISRSIGNVYDGPGNGTGPIDSVVASAVAKGMTWFNAAGNSGGRNGTHPGGYWRGGWRDTDADGWQEFGAVGELLPVNCNFFQGLRWNDWGGSGRTDYDIYVFDEPTDVTPFDGSENNQTLGAQPLEHFNACWGDNSWDYLAVRLFDPGSGTGGDTLEVLVNGYIDQVWSNPHAAAHPASDSKSAGAVSVGAVDPALGTTIGSYSSHGPTNDGRIKPDISAASCVTSFTYRPGCFAGTSASTPVVAGAAAVLRDSGLATSATSVRSFLLKYLVADRGSSGSDNAFGAGELRLTLFADIPTSKFVRDIEWVFIEGITTGCSAGRYCPDGLVTRGQMATFLARALDLPPTSTDYFTDDETNKHEQTINRLRAAGITFGCGGSRFCPDGVVTRGQMASFLVRAFDLPSTATDYFRDDETNKHEANINRLRASGVTFGCTATTFCPNGQVTRGQMAAFIHRAVD